MTLGETTDLIGRRREVREVKRALSETGLVTLVGFGGMGKTRLARQVTRDLAGSEPEGAVLVDLAVVADPDLVAMTVADALGLRTQAAKDQTGLLAAHLRESTLLLALDNCEHVPGACVALVETLRRTCPGVRVLATSRQPLGVPGERVYVVPPLALPPADPPWEGLELVPSVALFLDRAAAVLPGFTLTEGNSAAVARLCRGLEGVPLALELAAARIRALSPQAMLERLEDRYRLLGRGFSSVPPRQRSLAASVRWSHDLCSRPEQLLWARLSVFRGGIDVAAATAVCSGDGVEAAEVPAVLASLCDRSVLTRDPDSDRGGRYLMPESLRQFGARNLDDGDEAGRWAARHAAWFEQLAADFEAAWTGPDQPTWLAHLRREHDNLQQVLERAVHGDGAAPAVRAVRTCVALAEYWVVTGLLGVGRHWLGLVVDREGLSVLDRARGLWLLAYLEGLQADHERARVQVASLTALAAASGDPRVAAYSDFAEGMVECLRGDAAAAVPPLARSRASFAVSGDLGMELLLTFNLAMCQAHAGDVLVAQDNLTGCHHRTEELGEHYLRSYCLWLQGEWAIATGDLATSTARLRTALDLKWQLRDQVGMGMVLEALAAVASAAGDGLRAATLLGCAQAIWRPLGTSALNGTHAAAQRELGERLAREAVADHEFDLAFSRGLALSQDEAVALALGGRALGAGQSARGAGQQAPPGAGSPGPLSARESEVARLVAEGLTDRQVAAALVVSVRTAQGHVQRILRKLGLTSRAQVRGWLAQQSR